MHILDDTKQKVLENMKIRALSFSCKYENVLQFLL